MEIDRIWILFARKVSGEITPEELKELEELIRRRPDGGYSMEIILRMVEANGKNEKQTDADISQRLWPKLKAAMERTENRPRRTPKKIRSSNPPFMLRSYLRIAIRNLQKQKGFAFINMAGLAVGIACFSLLILYVTNERSFDRFHRNASNIYRCRYSASGSQHSLLIIAAPPISRWGRSGIRRYERR